MSKKHRLFLLVLTVAVALSASSAEARRKRALQGRPADAVEVFRCGFDDLRDINYDKWPDRWKRHEGPGYPHYVDISIADDPSTSTGRCLMMKLDGAQAKVSSPPVRVLPKFSYWLELKVKTENVRHSKVYIQFDYLNAAGEVRQTRRSEALDASGGWITYETGSMRPEHQDIDRAIIRIETERGEQGDLQGVVSIADLWLARLPSLDVSANNPFHLYTDPKDVVITCSLSGIQERNPEIRFQLLDATERTIGDLGRETLQGQEIKDHVADRLLHQESRQAAEIVVDGVANHATGFEGSTEWRPEIHKHESTGGGYGFYQVRVEMLSNVTGKLIDKRKVTLAVIPPPTIDQASGEFGWTLPKADDPLSFDMLEQVLPLVGVNYVKLPVWFPVEQLERGEEIIHFAERLAASDIETIGVIEHPELFTVPEEERISTESYAIATVFGGDPSKWMPLYDHIMTRLSLRIRLWQLGGDHDTSFVGYDDLQELIRNVRTRLYRFGQDVSVGLGWRWDTPLFEKPGSWEFHQLSSDPPLSADELDAHLAKINRKSGLRWVLIEPVAADPNLTSAAELHVARVRELVKQIVVAKRHGAEGIFVANPFTGPTGLMTAEGKPGELLLPWRTSATLLGGAEYMGQLQLPNGSRNWLFRRSDGRVVMVVWNDQQTDETLYLGDDIMLIDVWGKRLKPSKVDGRDQIPVGPMPRFVVGLNEAVAHWRMSVKFDQLRVPSIFGQEHPNAITFTNSFGQGVGGTFKFFVPDLLSRKRDSSREFNDQWKIYVEDREFGVPAAGEHRLPLEIRLKDAAIGLQPIRIDFLVEADRAEARYKFSVWRSLQVGLGDVQIGVSSELDKLGRLIVHQQMTNTSGRLMSFKCFLHVQGRRRKRAQVFQIGPEPDIKSYTYSGGEELIGGEIKLRVEEIDGPRVLIQRFVAEP